MAFHKIRTGLSRWWQRLSLTFASVKNFGNKFKIMENELTDEDLEKNETKITRVNMEFKKTTIRLIPFFIFVAFIISIQFVVNFNENNISSIYTMLIDEDDNETIGQLFDKWIVITTISEISDDIKFMSTELTDWRIVIVADKKTPKNLTCNNCTFLSVENQLKLKYKTLPLVPFKSYTRKIVGYLYAIQHGAKYIYDTDDDNRPIKSKLDSFVYTNVSTGLVMTHNSTSLSMINAYAHFGRPDIWPRGFPLQLISDPYSNDYDFELRDPIRTPTIQQGLVNGDPDVDAVYRMISVKNRTRGLDVTFDPFAPPFVLPPNVYGPFNSQNTLFHYDAFWALLLPVTVTSRVTDIWRGYWAQRLMHLTQDSLGYFGANARQYRNPHHYFDDYVQENQLYAQSMDLVEAIHNWTCNSTSFSACLIELTGLMARKGFISEKDIRLSEKWVEDLTKIGYRFPNISITVNESLLNESRKSSCREVGFGNAELAKPENVRKDSLKTLYKFCHEYFTNLSDVIPDFEHSIETTVNLSSFSHTKNVVLIVTFNKPHFHIIPFLQTLYEPWFAKVIFCGLFPPDLQGIDFRQAPFDKLYKSQSKFTYIRFEEMLDGFFHYACTHIVMDMQISDADGYLLVGDDTLLNFWTPYDLTKVHMNNDCFNGDNWFDPPKMINLQTHMNATLRRANNAETTSLSRDTLLALNEILNIRMRCSADIFYVPRSLKSQYYELSKLFYEYGIFLEIAVPKTLAVLGWMKIYKRAYQGFKDPDLPGKYFWYDGKRSVPFNYFDTNDVFMHPVKLSHLFYPDARKNFCDKYVMALFNATGIV